MNKARREFYGRLHERDASYAAGSYDMAKLFRHRAFRAWAREEPKRPLQILDVGVSKGRFVAGGSKVLAWSPGSILGQGGMLEFS